MTPRGLMLGTLEAGFEVIDDDREALEIAVDVVALILRAVPGGARDQVGALLVACAVNRLARREAR